MNKPLPTLEELRALSDEQITSMVDEQRSILNNRLSTTDEIYDAISVIGCCDWVMRSRRGENT